MKLIHAIQKCSKCPELSTHRSNVVIGDGPIPCPIVFLGEAPGAQEDRTGKAFCGVAGDVLEIAAFQCGLERGIDYHVLNTLKCRPPNNRNPTHKELLNCRPYLHKQLLEVKPKVVLALGKFAHAFILDKKLSEISVLKNVGALVTSKKFTGVLTYHPAFIRRMGNPNITRAFKQHIRRAIALSKGV